MAVSLKCSLNIDAHVLYTSAEFAFSPQVGHVPRWDVVPLLRFVFSGDLLALGSLLILISET
jgi:hypothetical protein